MSILFSDSPALCIFFSKTKNKKSWIKKNLWNRRHGSWLFCWFGLCWARCQGWTAVTWLLRPWCTLTTTLHHSHRGCKKKECVLVRLVGLHSRRHPRTQNTPSHPHFQVQGVPLKSAGDCSRQVELHAISFYNPTESSVK